MGHSSFPVDTQLSPFSSKVTHRFRAVSAQCHSRHAVSKCFKVLEHLIHTHAFDHSSTSSSVRRRADSAGVQVPLLARWSMSSACALQHTRLWPFDTSWVEAMLVRLHDIGVRGPLWHLITNFLRQPVSQVRLGGDLSEPWPDSGIAQGRVLSPLLFRLLVDGLAAAVQHASPGVLLPGCVDSRFTDQLYADHLVLAAESPSDLQTALNAVSDGAFDSASDLVLVPPNHRLWCSGPDAVLQNVMSSWVE